MDEIAHLHQVGLKATLPRLKVLEILRQGERRHLSAEEVHRALLQTEAEVGLATVYRVLGQLEQAGIVARRNFDPGPAVYEIDEGEHHDHLVCVHCGRVDEFEDLAIEARQQTVAEARGFRLTDHRLALYGRCRHCQPPAARPAPA